MNTQKVALQIHAIRAVREELARGLSLRGACAVANVSAASYLRWAERYDTAGLEGLGDLPRSGRPPMVVVSATEAAYLRGLYLRSNLRRNAGSMTLVARMAARDSAAPLSPEVRAAILAPRASKHALPVEVRRAIRASTAEVRRYRDPKAGQNDGIYAPGTLRMVPVAVGSKELRRMRPGERQVWDDASVNVGVVVPWARGGDKCSDRWGCRVARFQLLLGIDCATDMVVGYHYVMKQSDAYGAADVVCAFHSTWNLAGGAPKQVVVEGGSWQAQKTLDYLAAAGVEVISAKGRPNQKLVEGYFNRLWTAMSITLPPNGQVGRFRGEMRDENTDWRRAREGIIDPRTVFPELTTFLDALDASIRYLNAEKIESRQYGSWVPQEAYGTPALQVLPEGIEAYAMPVVERRRVRRQGLVSIRTTSPLGWPHDYVFAIADGYKYDGAMVTISFDPANISRGAIIHLAEQFADEPIGRELDDHAELINAAPSVMKVMNVGWVFSEENRLDQAKAAKRRAMSTVAAQTAAFDARGGVTKKTFDKDTSALTKNAIVEAITPVEPETLSADDLDALERNLGIYTA